MTLQEIKEQFAKENGFGDWKHLLKSQNVFGWDSVDEITRRYAKAKLEEAAESVGKECGVNELKAMITGTTLN